MKLYIETSVPNFLFTDDAPDKRRITELFFDWLALSPHDLFVSDEVELEMSRAPEPKRARMRDALRRLPLASLEVTAEAEALAALYIREGVLPGRFEADAVHVAVAVCHGLDVVVTWNMKHLANARRVMAINIVNERLGLPAIRVQTPAEIMRLE